MTEFVSKNDGAANRSSKKHSLDSDEEDEAEARNYDPLDDDDIEGQEEATVAKDGEIQITPFNLRDEQQEGEFSKEGDFIWKKDKEEIKDSWLDNIDWVKVEERSEKLQRKLEDADEKEDTAAATYDELETYKAMGDLLMPGETVARALRRLAGSKKPVSASQRWKKKKKGDPESSGGDAECTENHAKMLKLTGLADAVLSRSGNMEIYDETSEKIAYRLSQAKRTSAAASAAAAAAAATEIPDDVDEDDALDMFAEAADSHTGNGVEATQNNGTAAKSSSTSSASSGAAAAASSGAAASSPGAAAAASSSAADADDSDEPDADDAKPEDTVKWEFKWENSASAEVHGPHDTEAMAKWQESGFFAKGVFVRQIGKPGGFHSSRRIDFDLYM